MLPIGKYFPAISNSVSVLTWTSRFVFRWLAIPWLQKEIDSYVYTHNTTRRRASRRKIIPNGIPDIMFEYPESAHALDFKVILGPK
jgi:hypothetical protein